MYYDAGLDGYTSDPNKYHYPGSVSMRRSRRAMYDDSVYAPSLSRRESLHDGQFYSDPYIRQPRRRSFARSGSVRPSTGGYYDAAAHAADYYDNMASDYYAGSGRTSSNYYDGAYSGVPRAVMGSAPVVRGDALASEGPDTLLLWVPLCCDGCERRINRKLLRIPGVMSVWCDVPMQQVRVRGYFDADEVLRTSRRAFRNSRIW